MSRFGGTQSIRFAVSKQNRTHASAKESHLPSKARPAQHKEQLRSPTRSRVAKNAVADGCSAASLRIPTGRQSKGGQLSGRPRKQRPTARVEREGTHGALRASQGVLGSLRRSWLSCIFLSRRLLPREAVTTVTAPHGSRLRRRPLSQRWDQPAELPGRCHVPNMPPPQGISQGSTDFGM